MTGDEGQCYGVFGFLAPLRRFLQPTVALSRMRNDLAL